MCATHRKNHSAKPFWCLQQSDPSQDTTTNQTERCTTRIPVSRRRCRTLGALTSKMPRYNKHEKLRAWSAQVTDKISLRQVTESRHLEARRMWVIFLVSDIPDTKWIHDNNLIHVSFCRHSNWLKPRTTVASDGCKSRCSDSGLWKPPSGWLVLLAPTTIPINAPVYIRARKSLESKPLRVPVSKTIWTIKTWHVKQRRGLSVCKCMRGCRVKGLGFIV